MVSIWQALWSFQNKIHIRLYLLSKWHHTLDSFYHITLCAHDPASGHAFHGCLTCRSRGLYVIKMLIADSWAENCFNYIIYDISPIYDPWPMDLLMIPDQWTYLRSLTNGPFYYPWPMHLLTIPDQWTNGRAVHHTNNYLGTTSWTRIVDKVTTQALTIYQLKG